MLAKAEGLPSPLLTPPPSTKGTDALTLTPSSAAASTAAALVNAGIGGGAKRSAETENQLHRHGNGYTIKADLGASSGVEDSDGIEGDDERDTSTRRRGRTNSPGAATDEGLSQSDSPAPESSWKDKDGMKGSTHARALTITPRVKRWLHKNQPWASQGDELAAALSASTLQVRESGTENQFNSALYGSNNSSAGGVDTSAAGGVGAVNGRESGENIFYQEVDASQENQGEEQGVSVGADIHIQKHTRTVKKKKKKGKGGAKPSGKRRRIRLGKHLDPTNDRNEFLLTMGMLLGLRVAVGRQPAPLEGKELAVEDFFQVDKYVFPPSGATGILVTPPHRLGNTFKFKDYAPKVFKRIREVFGVRSIKYLLSVAGNYRFLEFISNAKSKEFFFFSHDERFLIKTMKPAESKFLRRIIPHYYMHVRQNPDTFLVKFYGMYRVKMHHIHRKVHFIVMNSVFNPEKLPSITYDLKGSLHGRISKEDEKVKKDRNLIETGQKLHLGSQKEKFLKVITKDANFLASMSIMDYSLLLGIHDRSRPVEQDPEEDENDGSSRVLQTIVDTNKNARSNSLPRQQQQMHSRENSTGDPNINIQTHTNTRAGNHASGSSGEQSGEGNINNKRNKDVDINHMHGLMHDMGSSILASERTIGQDSDEEQSMEGDDIGIGMNLDSNNENGEDEDEDSFTEEDGSEFVLTDTELDQISNSSPQKGPIMQPIRHESEPRPMNADGHEGHENPITRCDTAPTSLAAMVAQGENYTPPVRVPQRRQQNRVAQLTGPSSHLRKRRDGGINSEVDNKRSNEVYFMGIIDILQQYNTRKQGETAYKSLTLKKAEISCVDPAFYAKRFVSFLDENID